MSPAIVVSLSVPPFRSVNICFVHLDHPCGGENGKNLPVMCKTQIQFLGWEDPLEKAMAIRSSSLAWEIPWTEEPGGLQHIGSQELDTT